MREPLLFVSGNPGKVREIAAMFGAPVRGLDLDLPEIQSLAVAEVARAKARAAFDQAGQPLIVEDTGLYIDALGGLPGALVRWFLATIGPAGIASLLPADASRAAVARTAIAYCDGDTVTVFVGETTGEIAAQPEGDQGFGWDPIFRPTGSPRTFAEMDLAEKTVSSMRRKALDQLRTYLNNGS